VYATCVRLCGTLSPVDVLCCALFLSVFSYNANPTTVFYTLSLHDALPIWLDRRAGGDAFRSLVLSRDRRHHAGGRGSSLPRPGAALRHARRDHDAADRRHAYLVSVFGCPALGASRGPRQRLGCAAVRHRAALRIEW